MRDTSPAQLASPQRKQGVLHAANARTTHVHVIVSAERDGDDVMNQFKAWCSRKLSDQAGLTATLAKKAGRRHWFTEGGDKNKVENEQYLQNAIRYVVSCKDREPEAQARCGAANPCLRGGLTERCIREMGMVLFSLLSRRPRLPRAPVNLADPAFKANPFPFYARLRNEAPIHRMTLPTSETAWLITRYDDVPTQRPRVAKTREGGYLEGIGTTFEDRN